MRKSLLAKAITGLLAVSFLVGGCGRSATEVSQDGIQDNTQAGVIDYETSTLGIDSGSKDFEENLVSGTFYVVHDGIYYPTYTYLKNEEAEDEPDTRVSRNRMAFYTTENFINIPTLFPGDHLVYYSDSNLLSYVVFERFEYMGYTFGVRNLEKTITGRYYVNLEADEECLIPDSELYDMYTLDVEKVMIDKVGGVVVDDSIVDNGIIVGVNGGKSYDMEVYTGTNYKHYTAVSNIIAMRAYELFASAEVETLQDCFWEIGVPDYLVDGYYDVDGCGMIRIVKEPYYSDETDYNVQLLFPNPNTSYGHEDEYVAPSQYSEFPDLNYFTTSVQEGVLGYVDPEAEDEEEEITEDMLPDAAKFKEANTKEYELWFPENKQCSITIRSNSGETTGQAVVSFDTGATASLTYNRFDDVYELTINGKGNKGSIAINGFWFDYEIELKNVEIYNGQDLESNVVDSDMEESPVREEGIEEDAESTDDAEDSSENVFEEMN